MNQETALAILRHRGAVITGSHIVYTSGRHGADYVNKDAVYPYITDIMLLCEGIAEQFVHSGVQVVIGPAIGAVVLSQRVAEQLERFTGQEVLSIYAEKAENGKTLVIRRGYDRLIAGKQVLVVEDVLTTGGSALMTVEAAIAAGGHVVGVGALCNRGGVTTDQIGNVPVLYALVNISMESWSEAECPLCAQDVPVNADVGKGRDFLARKNRA